MDVLDRSDEAALKAPPATLLELRQHLRERLALGRTEHFGRVREDWSSAAEDYFWDESHQEWRFDVLLRHGVRPRMHRLLDMSSGCGQFVLAALRKGYDCEGVEPDSWRRRFVARKIELCGYPSEWKSRFHEGVGESLPFPNDSFDYVTSFQTLEHVLDPERVIVELVRITKVGGAIHIMCPDYRSTFEAHYQLPWLPLFPRPLARLYLRALHRPTKGLDTIQYTTRPRLLSWIRAAEAGKRFLVCDENRVIFENALRRRGLPNVPGAYLAWRLSRIAASLGRLEMSISLFLRILVK